jgi:MGT family glycosyltransferase
VYVTFGSVAGQFEQAASLYAMLVEALAEAPARVLLTTGRALDPAQLPEPAPNVRVEQWVPQAHVLPHATAVVCHGGAGSTLGALAYGRPLVVVPLFADQPHNARRVEAVGAGVVSVIEPQALLPAIEHVLGTPAYAQGAAGVAGQMRTQVPAADAVKLLESL